MSTGELLGKPVYVVEVAVRLVLVLLIQLVVIKAIIVELGGRRCRRCSSTSRLACSRFLCRGREWDYPKSVSDVFFTMLFRTVLFGKPMREDRTLLGAQIFNIDCLGFFGRRGVKSGTVHAGVVSPGTTESAGERTVSNTSTLDSQGLAHDRAASSKHLQIGHAACAWRNMVLGGGRRERAERGGRGLGQEWTHGARLAQNGLHGGERVGLWSAAPLGRRRVLGEESTCVGAGTRMWVARGLKASARDKYHSEAEKQARTPTIGFKLAFFDWMHRFTAAPVCSRVQNKVIWRGREHKLYCRSRRESPLLPIERQRKDVERHAGPSTLASDTAAAEYS